MPDVQLLPGDCLAILPTLPAQSVDAVVTSPPYAEQRKAQYGGIPEADYPAWTVAWLDALRPALKPTGSVLINIREHVRDGQISDYVHRTRLAVRAAGWIECDELIWIKPGAPPVGHPGRPRRSWERILWFAPSRQPWCNPKANGNPSNYIGMVPTGKGARQWVNGARGWAEGTARSRDYIELAVGHGASVDHPAAYPVPLAAWMLRLVVPLDGVVLDPFAGSGTTGIAAIETARRAILIEQDPGYCEIITRRLAATQPALPEAAVA